MGTAIPRSPLCTLTACYKVNFAMSKNRTRSDLVMAKIPFWDMALAQWGFESIHFEATKIPASSSVYRT